MSLRERLGPARDRIRRLIPGGRPATPLTSRADVPTDAAARYAKQLASHLGRKATVTEEAAGPRIHIGEGSCLLVAGGAALVLHAEAPSPEALDRVQDVIGRHLVKFGRRDELVVEWISPSPGTLP
jgi:hypothetical protein